LVRLLRWRYGFTACVWYIKDGVVDSATLFCVCVPLWRLCLFLSLGFLYL
jgi:hypothetical protein